MSAATPSTAGWTPQQQLVASDQAVERAQYAASLAADPGTYAAFVAGNANALASDAVAAKRAAFAKAAGDAARYADMDRNAAGYDDASQRVNALQAALAPEQDSAVAALTTDLDTSRRQWELNEWAAANKRDALFWLQLALIATLACVLLAYGVRSGWLPRAIAVALGVTLGAIVVVVGAYRYRFNRVSRDTRYWNKRRFAASTSTSTASTGCASGGPFVINSNDFVPASVTSCASQLVGGVSGLESALTSAASAAQSTATPSSSTSVCGAPL